ncbi:hypothetical protein [Pseudorhodoferax sp.]|uniref:hypothetical protein n=1 Tax=Pseudorhodoferax sp. TaxID=1993553 RepID=UPI002DD62526|nr:hypothetical protein [Pseudorhodoferax sp.]
MRRIDAVPPPGQLGSAPCTLREENVRFTCTPVAVAAALPVTVTTDASVALGVPLVVPVAVANWPATQRGLQAPMPKRLKAHP